MMIRLSKMRRLARSISLVWALSLATVAPVGADQSSIVTPLTGPHSMTDFVTNFLNPALRALLSCSSGSAVPTNGPSGAPMAGQCWLDTSAAPLTLRVYDGSQWLALANIDASGHIVSFPNPTLTGPVKLPALTGYVYSPGNGALVASTIIPTAALNGFLLAANFPAVTGDVSIQAGSTVATAAIVNTAPGSYGAASSIPVVTVDGKGRVTGVTLQTVVAPAGTLTGAVLAAGVKTSSLESFAAGAAYNNLAANSVDPSKMSQAPAGTLRGNPGASTANVSDNALTAYSDVELGSTARGYILYRGASKLLPLTPGSAGTVLTSNGPGADPTYQGVGATGQLAGFRNRLINGDMSIDQKNGGAQHPLPANALTYGVDRFYTFSGGAATSGQRVAGSGNTQYRYQITAAAGVTSLNFGQRIEARNSYDWAGQTTSFGVDLADSSVTSIGWTASYATAVDNWASATTIASGTCPVSAAISRCTGQISIPGAATTGVRIEFSAGAQTSGTLTIGNAQWELGGVATTFERRPIGFEMLLCQRYLFSAPNSWAYFVAGIANGTSSIGGLAMFPVPMRITPNVTGLSYSTTNTGAPGVATTSPYSISFATSTSASGGGAFSVNAGLFNAEL